MSALDVAEQFKTNWHKFSSETAAYMLAAAQYLIEQNKEIKQLKLRELTDEEIWEIHDATNTNNWVIDFARAILKKASEK